MVHEDGSCSCGSKVGEYNLQENNNKKSKKSETKQVMPKRKKRAGKFTKAFYFVLKYLPPVTGGALLYTGMVENFINSSNPLVMVGIVLLFAAAFHWLLRELYRYGRKEDALPNHAALLFFFSYASFTLVLFGYLFLGRILADIFYDGELTFGIGALLGLAGTLLYAKKADGFLGKHEKKPQETTACSCG